MSNPKEDSLLRSKQEYIERQQRRLDLLRRALEKKPLWKELVESKREALLGKYLPTVNLPAKIDAFLDCMATVLAVLDQESPQSGNGLIDIVYKDAGFSRSNFRPEKDIKNLANPEYRDTQHVYGNLTIRQYRGPQLASFEQINFTLIDFKTVLTLLQENGLITCDPYKVEYSLTVSEESTR